MMQNVYGQNTIELTTMLGLTVSTEMAAKANALGFGHVLKEDNHARKALNFGMRGKKERLKSTPKGKVKDNFELSSRKILN